MTATDKLDEQIRLPNRKCGFLAYHRAPRCDRFATVHASVDVEGRGKIGIPSCDAHRDFIGQAGWILDMHTFGPGCAHAVSTWGSDGCLPGM